MRFPARFFLAFASLLIVGGSASRAEGVAQFGTLQMPSHPPPDRRVNPSEAAPRQPGHKVGPANKGKTPVVRAHGPIHPHKPVTAAIAAKAAPNKAAPPPVVPAKPVAAQPGKLPDSETQEGAAAKLPRFVSLRSDDVNMRAGPGTRYRIDWVYKRRDLPVEIEREFEVWRWVRDADGVQGWVHEATLMGRRTFIVQKAEATLRSDESDTASAVAILKPGVIGRIRSCEAASDWCNVQTGSYRGYLRREQFWGVLPHEAINP